ISSGRRRVLMYDRPGTRVATPALLVHGLGGSAASFALIASALLGDGRRICVLELPGHGRNALRRGEEAANLAEQVEALHAAPAVQRLLAQIGEHALEPADLARIEQPVLILWGDSDGILPSSSVEWFRTHLKTATVEVIPGCGHLPQMEQRAAVVARLRQFL